MKAKIQYTVDFDDIVKEVVYLLRRLPESNQILDVLSSLAGDDLNRACKEIDEYRKELSKLDMRLEDCYSILMGYQKALFATPEDTEGSEAE